MQKFALITGGSRGIGLGIAQHLAKEGFNLAINGVRPAADVRWVLDELSHAGVRVIYCQGNVGEKSDREAIIEKVRNEFGALHVLVNNAGVAPNERRDLLDMSEESWERVMGINLQGPFFLTQSIANWMLEQKSSDENFDGCFVNISSISATVASINRGEYAISKAGMRMMTQLFAARLGPFDIPVYEIQPGIIETDMTSAVKEKYDKLIAEGLTVQPRWGSPDDIGRAVAALVRGDFRYSSGSVFMADGGLTIPRL